MGIINNGELQKPAAFAMCFVDSDSQIQILISLAQSEKIHISPYMHAYTFTARMRATPYK